MQERIQITKAERRLSNRELVELYPELQGKSSTTLYRLRQGHRILMRGYRETLVRPNKAWNKSHARKLSMAARKTSEKLRNWLKRTKRSRSAQDIALGLTSHAADLRAIRSINWSRLVEMSRRYLRNHTGTTAWQQRTAELECTNPDAFNEYLEMAAFRAARRIFYKTLQARR